MMEKKRNHLFIVLASVFITNAVLAEMIGNKIFSLEKSIGLSSGFINIFGFQPQFNLTAGVVIWPVVFLLTDVINEYFGKNGVRKLSLIAVAMILYAFVVIWFTANLSPAEFWLKVNQTDVKGVPFDVNYAFKTIFLQSNRIIIGSLAAFLVGQLLDVFIFQKLKRFSSGKMIWLRATGSTLVSQLVDSFIVLYLAFYLLLPESQRWSLTQVGSVGVSNYVYKFIVAILLTPLIYLAHYFIDRYLGKDAERVKDEAMAS